MPKYKVFHSLDFLAYVKRIHVSYHPGKPRSDVCGQLVEHMYSATSKKLFPKLIASYDILSYDAPSTVEIELVNGKQYKFLAEKYSLKEMQRQFDKDQFQAHLAYITQHSIEKRDDTES